MKTTTINNVQVTEEQLRNALAEIEAQAFPQEGDTWYSYDEDGAILEGEWGTSLWYLRVLEIGNCHRTREEAERVVAQRKAETKVCRRLRELEGDYVVKFDGVQNNAIPYYSTSREMYIDLYAKYRLAPPQWYSSKSAWEQVISEMEDDVKVMMGVEV